MHFYAEKISGKNKMINKMDLADTVVKKKFSTCSVTYHPILGSVDHMDRVV